MNLERVLTHLCPDAAWSIHGTDIIWHDAVQVQPTEQEMADAWAVLQAIPTPKIWPDAEHFVAEFSREEMAAIGLSSDPTIAGLRFLLSTWLSTVHGDDPRVLEGLDALVNTTIITPLRRSQILANPPE